MEQFNNREIATAIWMVLLLVYALRAREVRRSVLELVRAFAGVKVLVPTLLMVLYTGALAALLSTVGMWNASLLKDTILWFCLSAFAMAMDCVTSSGQGSIFRKVLADSVKVVIVIEFLVNTYTFSLGVELVLVPVLALMGVVDVIARSDSKCSAVAKLTTWLQGIIGLTILAFAARSAIADYRSLENLDTLRSVMLSPLLSILFSPFLYVMVLWARYETLFVRLELGVHKDKGLKRYARRRIVVHTGLSLSRLEKLLRSPVFDLMRVETRADVDGLLKRARTSENSRKSGVMSDE